ncbi:hypothetical protein FB451DRAFT_1380362 [Mycena latifolia]|nr:hypothetical protein FB451DRAFT_1380362 [Mycena latifolia]
MSRARPRVGPSLDFTTSTGPQIAQEGQDSPDTSPNEASTGRPKRAAKTAANTNAVWQGAAPTGPKPKNTASSDKSAKRKRSESGAQDSSKPKARKKKETYPSEDDDLMPASVPLPARKRVSRTVVHSEDEAPSAKPAAGKCRSTAVAPDLFTADNDDADSEAKDKDAEVSGGDGEGSGGDNDEDLQGLEAAGDSEGVARALAEERPQWTDEAVPDDVKPQFNFDHLRQSSRSSSRSSTSSGRMSVPSSVMSSDSDSDIETKAGFASLKKAQQLVSVSNASQPKNAAGKASSNPSGNQKAPTRGKRDAARDQERPTWNDPAAPLKGPPLVATSSRHGATIKLEPNVRPARLDPQPRRLVKQEARDPSPPRSSSPEVIVIDDTDDSDDGDSLINLVVTDRKVGLKQQHPRVEKTGQLAIDYYLGYYLWKHSFPSTDQKNKFSADALLNAAHSLAFEDVKKKVSSNESYRTLLGSVLHARVSTFRGKPKIAADMTVVSSYHLRGNTEERAAFLTTGMRYLHKLATGAIDPKTGKPGPDVVIKDTAYMAEGFTTTLSLAFFKGTPSVASKYSDLFVTTAGRKEVPAAMVALVGTAVHAAISEHRSGHHVASKFEGNGLHEVYETHIVMLKTICASGIPILANLYSLMAEGSGLGNVENRPMAMEALAFLGL